MNLINLAVASEQVGKNYKRLWAAVRYRDVPSTNIGGKWFIDEKDLPLVREYFEKKDARKKQKT